jgi:glutamate synthase (NADPH/NADH)
MLLVDTQAGRIIDNKELKEAVSSRQGFLSRLKAELLTMPKILEALNHPLLSRGSSKYSDICETEC